MRIIYLNKVNFPTSIPSTVFSALNAYGFAQNGLDTIFIARKNTSASTKEILLNYFGITHLPDFKVKLFTPDFLRMHSNEIFYLKAVKWLLKTAGLQARDVIITRDPGFLPYLIFLKKTRGCQAYYQSHNFYADLKLRPELKQPNKRRYSIFERYILPHLDGIITLQKPQRELFEKYFSVPVFTGYAGLQSIHRKKKSGLNYKKIAYIGSFQEFKGIETAVEVFSNLQQKDWKLCLIGGRNEQEISYVRALADKYGITDRVEITGWLSYQGLKAYLGQISIGLLLLRNTFYNRYLTAPSKLFDYLSNGIPLIASDLPSIRDLVTDKEALFVDPENRENATAALNKLIEDQELYQKMTEYCFTKAESYLWQKITLRMLSFIEGRIVHGQTDQKDISQAG